MKAHAAATRRVEAKKPQTIFNQSGCLRQIPTSTQRVCFIPKMFLQFKLNINSLLNEIYTPSK